MSGSRPAANASSATMPIAPADTSVASKRMLRGGGTASRGASAGPSWRTGSPSSSSPSYSVTANSRRRASVTTWSAPTPPSRYHAHAIASWLAIGTKGRAMPRAKACAAAMPTRSPVNGPGPMPAATPESRAGSTPAAVRASRMNPPITSACRMVSSVPVSARMPERSTTATLVPVEVSMARSMDSSLRRRRVPGARPAGAVAAHHEGPRLVGLEGIGCRGIRHRRVDGGRGIRHRARAHRTLDHDLEPRPARVVDEPRTPFDDDHRVLEVEVEVVEERCAAEAVRVDVHERRAADEARVRAGEHERGTLHRAAHPEAGSDAAGEGGLACSERAGEHDEVSGAELGAELATEGLHVVGARCFDLHHSPPTYVRGTRAPM